MVGIAHPISPDAWLPVNAHAHLDLGAPRAKVGFAEPGIWQGAGVQPIVRQAQPLLHFCRHLRHIVQARPPLCLRTGTREQMRVDIEAIWMRPLTAIASIVGFS